MLSLLLWLEWPEGMQVKGIWRRHLPIQQPHTPLITWSIWQWAVSMEKRSQWDGTFLLWLLYQPSLIRRCCQVFPRGPGSWSPFECSVFLDLRLGCVSVVMPTPNSLCSLALLFSCTGEEAVKRVSGQLRCPLLLCTWGLTTRGVWCQGKCGKVPVLDSVPELTVLRPSWDSAWQRTVCSTWWGPPCVCGWDTGRGSVDSKH